MIKKYIILNLLLFYSYLPFAQQATDTSIVLIEVPNLLDSNSLISYADKIVVKLNLDTKSHAIQFNNVKNGTFSRIKPNEGSRLFLSFDYEFLGGSIGFLPKIFPGNNDDNLKGKSKFSDFRFIGFIGKWRQEFLYQKIKGYYLENTGDIISNWVEGRDPYIQLPDLTSIKWSSISSFTLNPKFSVLNLLYQTEWQRKNSGTLEPKLHLTYLQFFNKEDGGVEDIYETNLSISYFYTFVLKQNWFFSPYLSPSIGMRFSKNKFLSNEGIKVEKNQFIAQSFETGMQLGYASEKFIYGAKLTFNANWYKRKNAVNIINDQLYGLIYFGYRFNAPNVLAKPFNWLDEKFGI